MKRKLRAVIITMVVLLVGTGAFLWKMNDMSKKLEEKQEAALKEERDLLADQKGKVIDSVQKVNIIPLYLSGDNKNVVTIDYASVSDIYSPERSAAAEDNLTEIKKNKSFSIKDALWAYNPYGTNRDSMYVYFETGGNCYCKYTISVDDASIPDFTRTARTGKSGNVAKEHEYQLMGLVPGMTNYITLRMYNSDDALSDQETFSVDVPASPSGAASVLTTQEGRSKTTISNGLYVIFQNENAASKAILLYDNSGILRGEIPVADNTAKNMEKIYDTLTYAVSPTQITQVNALGQVMKTHTLNGYQQSGEFAYDGYGNVYVIATAIQKKATPKSKIIELQLENGNTSEVLDTDTLLSSVYKKAAKEAKKANVDWIDLNSVQVVGTNTLLLSSKKLSSIFKVSNVGSILPKIDYIIADKDVYKGHKSLKKKLLTKSDGTSASAEPTSTATEDDNILHDPVVKEVFTSQFGQEAMLYQKKSGSSYYLSMLNNNTGSGAKENGESYYYRYQVDEETGTYQLKENETLEQTKTSGNVVKKDNGFVYCCSDKNYFSEIDKSGKLIKQFATGQNVARVYKNDFKKFWFY